MATISKIDQSPLLPEINFTLICFIPSLKTEKPPPYGTFESPEKRSVETDSDKDSMQFNENGSFIVEYGTVDKKPQPAFV